MEGPGRGEVVPGTPVRPRSTRARGRARARRSGGCLREPRGLCATSRSCGPTCARHSAARAGLAAGGVRPRSPPARDPERPCVASWDNLTNKGVVHELPDARVRLERRPAGARPCELHGVPARACRRSPARSATTTGSTRAPSYDARRSSAGAWGFRGPADRPLPLLVAVRRAGRGVLRPRWLVALRGRRRRLLSGGRRPRPAAPAERAGSGQAWSSATARRSGRRAGEDPVDEAGRRRTTSTRCATRPRSSA